METDKKLVEHRRAARCAAYMRASIFHPLQTEHLGCIVRDISEDGALIEFRHPGNLPKLFWLRLDGDVTLRLSTVPGVPRANWEWSSANRLWNAVVSSAGRNLTQPGLNLQHSSKKIPPSAIPTQSNGARVWSV